MNNVFNRKSAFTKLLSAWAALSVVATTTAPAFAAGTPVLGGNSELADLTRVTMDSNTPDAAVFSSTAASGVLDWTKFNIGAGQSMTFDGASTTFFNLVDGAAGKSQIDGIINGNGNVWVINPAGVAFGAGSKVDLGGLFAAAAGNIENAIALRDGTATLPTFSSFDGNVTTTGGFGVPSSQFSASQVALLGRKVSAAGDFAGADKLTLGASDKLVVVDDVYGGSVSIGLSDLVASDAEVSLGDLDVGGSLSVVAGNDVGVVGAVAVDGDVTVTVAKDLDIDVNGALSADGNVFVYSATSPTMGMSPAPGTAGKTSVDGTVEAGGNVYISVAGGIDIGGSVASASGNVLASSGSSSSMAVIGGANDVKVSGSVTAAAGMVDISAWEGSVDISVGHVAGSGGVNLTAAKDVAVGGSVTSEGDVNVAAANFYEEGELSVGGAIDAVGQVQLVSGSDTDTISIDGTVAAGSDVRIMSGGGLDIGGSVASAVGNVMAIAGYSSGSAVAGYAKDVKVSGSLSAAEDVSVAAWDGSVDISVGHVAGSGGVTVVAAKDVAVSGSVRSEGDVYVAAATSTAGGLSVAGDVEAGGIVRLVSGFDPTSSEVGAANVGQVNVASGNVVSRGGKAHIVGSDNVSIGASAKLSADTVGVAAIAGDVSIAGVVKADTAEFNAGKSVSAGNGDNEIGLLYSAAGGNVAIATKTDVSVGEISAGGASVSVRSVEGRVDVSDSVVVGATDGLIALDGELGVTSSGTLSVEHGMLEVYGNKGDIDLYNSADGVVLAGKIILVAEGNVYADNPNNVIGEVVKAQAGVGKELRIDVGGGEAVTIGDIYADTAYVRSERGTIKVVGDVSAPDMVYLETESGDVIVMEGCTVEARGDGAVVVLKAGRDIVNDGTLKSDGAVDLAAGRDIAGKGTVAAAGDVAATAGRSAGLKAENGISLGDVTAEGGDVSVSTVRGDIVVNGTVQSKADDGVVLLAAATDESEDGGIVVNDGGNLVAPGAEGTVIGIAGYGKLKAEGSLDDKEVLGLLKSARMLMGTSPAPESSVRIIEGANVAAGKRIVLEGRISVISAGTINAANAKLDVVAKEGSIDLYADGTGIVIAGGVSAEAGDAILIDNPGNAIGQLDRVKVGTGEVDINLGGAAGKVGVVGAADLTGGMAVGVGTMLLVGDIEQGGLVYIVSVDGDVVVAENCKIKATGDGAIAFLNAARDIRISGQVESDGMVQMVAGRDLVQEGTVAAGVVDVVATRDVELGDVQASSAVWIYDLDGDGIPDPQSIGASTVNGQIRVRDGASLQATDADGAIYLTADNGVVVGENSSIRANGARGAIYVSSLGGSAPAGVKGGALDLNGTLSATKEVLVINVNGDVNVGASGRISSDNTSFVEAKQGNMVVDGRVDSADAAFVSAIRGTGPQDVSVVVNGTVAGDNEVMVDTDRGDIVVNGSVQSSGPAGFAVVAADKSGDISFGALGSARGTSSVYVKAGGGNLVHQSGASVAAINGYADSVSLPAAVEGKDIVLQVNGSVGSAARSVAVDGNVVGLVSGDAYIAAAGAKDLKGGTKSFDQLLLPSFSGNVVTIDLTQLNADNAMFVGGSLSAYSAGQVQKGNVLEAGRDLTITAGTFGDVSYLQAGGTLSINNVGRSSSPQVAYFESVNGVEPRINNQPNGVAIFIDGRLVGGNLQVINEFGSDEAFMVDTPELKSTQGIFGSPTFMHGDLDVANPMEVGVIDYMIQEVPRLTLSSDFPADADQSVEASGLSQRDVYWFGQKTTAADN